MEINAKEELKNLIDSTEPSKEKVRHLGQRLSSKDLKNMQDIIVGIEKDLAEAKAAVEVAELV